MGKLWVNITNAVGFVTSSNAILAILTVPTITAQPQSLAVHKKSNASFSVIANSAVPPGYQWSLNGAALAGATRSTLTVDKISSGDAGSYTVVVTNAAGSVTSDVAFLTVDAPPFILTQPQSQTVILGQNASLSVVAIGLAPVTFQWSCNGTNLPNATNATLTLTSVNTNNAGAYSVVLANNQGSVTSSNALLTVLIPAGIVNQPASQSVAQGANAAFSVVATGTAPCGYQWTFNGTNLPGAGGLNLPLIILQTNRDGSNVSTLTLNNVQLSSAGIYAVLITNAAGSVLSSNATLTILVPPGVTTAPTSQRVTAGQTASFSVIATGTDPLAYQWSFAGTNLVGATNAWVTLNNVALAQAGSYAVVVTNAAGSATSAANLSVTDPVIILATAQGGMTPTGFAFQAAVPMGATYVVQASTNLQTWIPIATNVAASTSEVITDADAGSYSRRYYRAVAP